MATYPAHGAEGFLLLTLRDVEAWLPGASSGVVDQLALECVTLAIPAQYSNQGVEGERDVWLVLRVGVHEVPIAPTQVVKYTRSSRTFLFENPNRSSNAKASQNWTIKLAQPTGPLDLEDLETFEVILSQYAAVEDVEGPPPEYSGPALSSSTSKRPVPPIPGAPSMSKGPPPLPPRVVPNECPDAEADLKGRLVLVDEEDGEIVGTLGEQFKIHEDDSLRTKGHEKDAVVVDFPDESLGKPADIYIHSIPPEQQDFLMKTATLISRGIVLATGVLSSGMSAASSLYIAHSTPNEKPLVFSESTRGRVKRVHKISGKAVQVSAKTTGMIHEAIERAVWYVNGNKGKDRSRPPTPTPGVTHAPVVLPGAYFSPSSSSLAPPAASPSPAPGTPPPLPPRPPFRNRLLLSTDLLLTTIENSSKHLIEHGSQKLSEALGHKYGKDMGEASLLVGHTVRNVGIVYIDARGVGRRALLKKAGKSFVKAKLGHRDVVLGVDESGHGAAGTLAVQETPKRSFSGKG